MEKRKEVVVLNSTSSLTRLLTQGKSKNEFLPR